MSKSIEAPNDSRSGSNCCSLVADLCERVLDPECRLFAPLWHDRRLIITDGRIMVVMDDQPAPPVHWHLDVETNTYHPPKTGDDRERMRPLKADRLGETIDSIGECTNDLPAVDGPPDDLNPRWESMEECEHCDGRGWAECNMGHEHDCEDCRGEGEYLQTHPDAVTKVDVLGGKIAQRYCWIVSQLPSVRIEKLEQPSGDSIAFRFDGGRGIVMAMRD